ncbi:SLC13 family permease [Mesohalobacter halotolerans]|uniref:SLC13/DASS family transporter n=1 Tax=Mesohalobacter halotolerans TaxID=1883405 RepID=A0A4U5TPI6_9FLAO|nr:SLC13 family permease [Mesohalobacter halotolerans]MBS3738522.1 SLC13/DASS family transporter [Psychroflexus sp.]TKS55886.1 SLC13/DASS family transporter [Mesohalobacter halotolerans]
MADSRTYAGKFLRKINERVNWHSHFTLFILSVLVAFGLFYFVSDPEFNNSQNYVLFILFLSIALWVTEAIPPFAVGILIIGYLVFSIGSTDEPYNVKQYVQTWSDSVIWLFLGGFFLAEAMKKTGLDKDLLKLTVPKFGNKASVILLGLMMLTAVLSMLMSNTATTAMMIATITPILKTLGSKAALSKNLLIGIPAAASVGGMGTIIGSAPNAIVVGALEGVGIQISFLEWMMFGIPIALTLIMIFWYVLLKKHPIKTKTLQLDHLFNTAEERRPHKHAKLHKRITLIILSITLFLWLTSGITGIPVAAVSGIPIIALTMFSIIESDDVRALSWDTLMLVAGGLALGLAVQEQGLAQYFVSLIPASNINIYVLYIAFGLFTVVFSNIMSNTATATIFIPIAISLIMSIDVSNTITLPLIIGLSASCALLLPVSTPPNAIAFSTGMLKQSDFRFGGIFVGLLGPFVVMLWCMLIISIFY